MGQDDFTKIVKNIDCLDELSEQKNRINVPRP